MYSPGEVLNLAMTIEENGEEFYLELANLTHDNCIKELLLRLAEEEKRHRERFLQLKRQIDKTYKPDALEKVSRFLTAEALGAKLFSFSKTHLKNIDSFEEAIQLAITLEEDSIIFYELLKSLSDKEETIKVLDFIIEEESSHVTTLKEIVLLIKKSCA